MKCLSVTLLLLSLCAWAEDPAPHEEKLVPTGRPGEFMKQAQAQEYLSGAAYMAMMRQDVELLKKLKSMGWDPHQPTQGDFWFPLEGEPMLHAAVIFYSTKTIEWLVKEEGVKKDLRDSNGEVALRIIIWGQEYDKEHDHGPKDEEIRKDVSELEKPIIDLLKRDDDGGINGMYEAVLNSMAYAIRDEKTIFILKASKTPDPAKFFAMFRKFSPGVVAFEDAKKVDQMDTSGKKITFVTVQIEKVDDKKYTYKIDYHSGPMDGGGVNGRVISRYGYWIMITEGGYDS